LATSPIAGSIQTIQPQASKTPAIQKRVSMGTKDDLPSPATLQHEIRRTVTTMPDKEIPDKEHRSMMADSVASQTEKSKSNRTR
jgi:hypothetical protein